MKKIFIVVILIFTLCLTGCKDNDLNKISKNLTSYNLSVSYNQETQTLDCNENVSYINSSEVVLDCLKFHLYPNAFREGSKHSPVSLSSYAKAYPNGASYGSIKINDVKINGQNSNFMIGGVDENILEVPLNSGLYPNDRLNLEMDFDVIIPNVNHRFGYGNNTVNLANFFPIACVYENGDFKCDVYSSNGDPFYSEMANFNITFYCDEKFTVASTGQQTSVSVNEGVKKTVVEAKVVRDFSIVCSSKFKTKTGEANQTKINYYYYGDTDPDKSFDTIANSLKTFEDMIGDYPYSQISVVEANFVHGGMEYPNLIYISDSCSSHEEYENVIIHEMAHQWWYGIVGNNEYSNSWLDEGLTEYTTALFYERNPEYQIELKNIVKNNLNSYALFVSVYQNVFGKVDTSMNRQLNEFSTETEYVYMSYVKGLLVFDSLREVIGDEKFFKGLKIYFNENKYKISTVNNLVSAFNKASGVELDGFFGAWTDGKIILINQI